MRRNPSTESSTFAPRAEPRASTLALFEARSRGALVGSLLLLAASFGLLVLAPQLLARFQSASESSMPAGGFLPMAAASGIALGGGAAMIAVMARLVRDIEIRPYACLAPVLAVFTGYVMWGLRATLPLESVSTEYVAVFALAVTVAGGSLVAQRSGETRGLGWALVLFAPLALAGLLWANAGQTNPGPVLAELTPQVKMYLGLLLATAFAMGLLGEGARVLARRTPYLTLPRTQAYEQGAEAPLFEQPAQREREREYEPPRYEPPPMRFDIKPAQVPRVNVWEFEDEDLAVPKKGLPWLSMLLTVALAGGAGAAFYYGVFLPKQQKEQAALQEKQEHAKAADAQELAQGAAAAARVESVAPADALPAAAGQAAGSVDARGSAREQNKAPVATKAAPAATALQPTVTSVAPAQKAAAATPPVKRSEPARAEPAKKAAPAAKPAGEVGARGSAREQNMADEPRNNDPIYGL